MFQGFMRLGRPIEWLSHEEIRNLLQTLADEVRKTAANCGVFPINYILILPDDPKQSHYMTSLEDRRRVIAELRRAADVLENYGEEKHGSGTGT